MNLDNWLKTAITSVVSIIIATAGVLSYVDARMAEMVRTKSPYVEDRRYIEETLKDLKDKVEDLNKTIEETNRTISELNGHLKAQK